MIMRIPEDVKRKKFSGGKMAAEKVAYGAVSQSEKYEDPAPPEAPKGIGVRHIQALMLFICLAVGYFMRAHLSVCIVAMTHAPNKNNSCLTTWNRTINNESTDFAFNETAIEVNRTIVIDDTPCNENTSEISGVYKTYEWNKATQDMILTSFFVGYTTMMIPMGMLAQKYGGKIPIMIALAANGVLSMLTPWLPMIGGWVAVCVCRFLQGTTQAAFYPSIHTILGHWAPLSERGRISTYVYTGSPFGTVLAFQLAGFFAGSPSLGWPVSFWLSGVASLICCGLLAYFGAATPHEHSWITSEEVAYITGDGNVDVDSKGRRTPWKAILTSTAVWGLVAAGAGSTLSYILILTQIPLYMDKVLGVGISKNGVFSSLGYIAMYFMAIGFGIFSDFLVNRKIMTVVNVRRLSNSIGTVVPSLFLVAFGFVHSTVLAVILLVFCISTHSGIHTGFHINHIDLAPNFAGAIMSIGNMVGNLASLLSPVLVSNIVGDDMNNQHKWQILFIITAALMTTSNLIFVVLVKGEVQPWNFYGYDAKECPSKEMCLFNGKETISDSKENIKDEKNN